MFIFLFYGKNNVNFCMLDSLCIFFIIKSAINVNYFIISFCKMFSKLFPLYWQCNDNILSIYKDKKKWTWYKFNSQVYLSGDNKYKLFVLNLLICHFWKEIIF